MPDSGLQTDAVTQPAPGIADPAATEQRSSPRIVTQVVESLQIVLAALMLAFMFRAFFVEPFVIPTGSMAHSLLGRHGAMVCSVCGWEFDYGPAYGRTGHDRAFVAPATAYCPNCHARTELRKDKIAVKTGDRILVHKWPYVFGGVLGPRRWDVIVFRDPSNPVQNYIKRLIALPNETIEIIDGDVFIKAGGCDEFRIARKTAAAQSMLWFVVFDQDYLPTDTGRANRSPAWVAEAFGGQNTAGWSCLARRSIHYEALDHTPRAVTFEPTGSLDYLQDVYAYNHGAGGNYVGDVRILAEVTLGAGSGWLRWEIVRDGKLFAAQFHRDGRVSLTMKAGDADVVTLGSTILAGLGDLRPCVLEFGHLDYRVYVKVDGRLLLATTDEQYTPRLDELRDTRRVTPLRLRMVAESISLEMRGLRVDRDVYYTYSASNTQRAYANHPFRLDDGEYFVLGDNSPSSHDSREWYAVGPHLREALRNDSYHVGTVRADQIVGQAFFVYLPGLLPLDRDGRWRLPDLGRARFIR